MVTRARGEFVLQRLSLFIAIHLLLASANFFKPFNVTYDHRALIIDGHRRMLISGGIHYPRATPEVLDFHSFLLLLDHCLLASVFYYRLLCYFLVFTMILTPW